MRSWRSKKRFYKLTLCITQLPQAPYAIPSQPLSHFTGKIIFPLFLSLILHAEIVTEVLYFLLKTLLKCLTTPVYLEGKVSQGPPDR